MQLFAYRLEFLVLGQLDRSVVAHALQFARRVFDIGLHQRVDCQADRHHGPGALGDIAHEDVVALLRILQQVEDLRHGRHVFCGTFPAQVGVHRQATGLGAIVAAQVEHRLVVANTGRAGR
ncbi:hypothetical protein D3C84_497230 [compost metagenome]